MPKPTKKVYHRLHSTVYALREKMGKRKWWTEIGWSNSFAKVELYSTRHDACNAREDFGVKHDEIVPCRVLPLLSVKKNRKTYHANIAISGRGTRTQLSLGLDWINSDQPISIKELRGHIVILHFWTFC